MFPILRGKKYFGPGNGGRAGAPLSPPLPSPLSLRPDRALNSAPHRRYLTEFWNFAYGLRVNGKKIICIFGNIITLKIILRNEIPRNNDLFKVTST